MQDSTSFRFLINGVLFLLVCLCAAASVNGQSDCWPPDPAGPHPWINFRNSVISSELESAGSFWSLDFHGDSVYRYISSGRIWIGGLVESDSLVSANDPVSPYIEWIPSGDGAASGGSVKPLCASPIVAVRSECIDTILLPYHHTPLGLRMAVRAYLYPDPVINQALLYDVVVTNIGARNIQKGYIGLYVDADAALLDDPFSPTTGWMDDLTGSLRERGLALAFDNDGDPAGGIYTDKSVRQALAVQFLATSFSSSDTSYNWWNYDYPTDDLQEFGPRRKSETFYAFADSSLGYPPIDPDKYYVMSSGEWDYDQVYTRHISPDDSIWMYPDQLRATDISDGSDLLFCLSIGSFDLPPDSSIRFQFTTLVGDNVHRDPYITDFLYEYPELFMLSLNLRNLLEVSDSAAAFAARLREPTRPPTGLQLEFQSDDSIVVRWDPWVFNDVTGYEVYLAEIPTESLPYPGVYTPFVTPGDFQHAASTGPVSKFVFDTLASSKFYYCSVANRTADTVGALSSPRVIYSGYRPLPPEPAVADVFHTTESGAEINWSVPDSPSIDHYNIYRFMDRNRASRAYLPYYGDDSDMASRNAVDTFIVEGQTYYFYRMSPYAVVSGDRHSYIDESPVDGMAYRITAVDRDGFESQFSAPVITHEAPPRTRDILVVTNGAVIGTVTYPDTISNFYHSVLSGYDYHILSVADSTGMLPDTSFWRVMGSYRLVIVDDILRDQAEASFTPIDAELYTLGGGTVVCFGSMFARTNTQWTTVSPGWHAPDSVTRRVFGIDSIYQTTLKFYRDSTALPYVDSCYGFTAAAATEGSIPAVGFGIDRTPFRDILLNYWPTGTAPIPSAFAVRSDGLVIHTFQSAYPDQSRLHGLPVGVRTDHAAGSAYAFGFHLWYMDPEDARSLIDWIMERVPTDAPDDPAVTLPDNLSLSQNYPNPFNPSTTISFDLPQMSHVRLDIFNILGQRVATLLDESLPAGRYEETWNGCDDHGERVSSGVYFYRLGASERQVSRKMILLK